MVESALGALRQTARRVSLQGYAMEGFLEEVTFALVRAFQAEATA